MNLRGVLDLFYSLPCWQTLDLGAMVITKVGSGLEVFACNRYEFWSIPGPNPDRRIETGEVLDALPCLCLDDCHVVLN